MFFLLRTKNYSLVEESSLSAFLTFADFIKQFVSREMERAYAEIVIHTCDLRVKYHVACSFLGVWKTREEMLANNLRNTLTVSPNVVGLDLPTTVKKLKSFQAGSAETKYCMVTVTWWPTSQFYLLPKPGNTTLEV